MARPSKKGAKTEAEVVAEAKRKKEILDQVAQSNMPTKTILKELGISRSTYYSWLKRYEEEGDEGLLDSRSLTQTAEKVEETAPGVEDVQPQPPVTVAAEETVEEKLPEPVAEEVIEKEPVPPPAEEPVVTPAPVEEDEVVQPEEPAAAPPPVEPEKTEEVTIPEPMMPPGGGQTKKGLGGYGFIAVMLLVVGLLLSISLSNQNNYKLKKSSNTLTLWKGKFAPRGFEQVESFQPVAVGDNDVSALTNRTFTGKDAAYKAIFAFFMDQVNGQTAQGDDADISKINIVLDQAESFLNGNGKKDRSMAAMQFQLAQKRVAMAELGLHKAYQQALPIYQEALRTGLADAATLEAKLDSMQQALGLVPVVTPEEPGQEAEVTSTEEAQTTEAEGAVAPEGSTKEVEATAAEETEVAGTQETEVKEPGTTVGAQSTVGESDTVVTETETEATAESAKPEEETEKPTSFMEWLRSKQY